MTPEKRGNFWQVSRDVLRQVFTKESLTNAVQDLTETVAFHQKNEALKGTLEKVRKEDSDRYYPNFWLSAYQIVEGDVQYVQQRWHGFKDFWLDVDRNARGKFEAIKDSPLSQSLGKKAVQVARHLAESKLVQDLGQAVDEGILDEVRYVASSLQTQKELLISDIRDVLFNENDKIYQALHQSYFSEAEEEVYDLNQGDDKALWLQAMKERMKEELSPLPRQFQTMVLQAWEKLKEMPEKAGYTVLDVLEMQAQESNPKLAYELARIRETCSERLPLNKVAEITEAVNAIGVEFHRIKEVITASRMSPEGGRC